MGKFNQMTVVATQAQEIATFVPSNPVLNGQPTTVVWRNQQGVGKIVAAGSVAGNIKIRLDTGAEFTCKPDVFGGFFRRHLSMLFVKHMPIKSRLLCVQQLHQTRLARVVVRCFHLTSSAA